MKRPTKPSSARRSGPRPAKVKAIEIFYPSLGSRNNVCEFTSNADEARRIFNEIEEDPHRGQDDREVREVELYFPGGKRFVVAYVYANLKRRFAASKMWRPSQILETPPPGVLVDNIAYERRHPSEPLLMSRAAAIAAAAKENARTLEVLAECPLGLHWALVAEVGQAVRQFSYAALAGELGRMELHTHCPIRVVKLTTAEVARHQRKRGAT